MKRLKREVSVLLVMILGVFLPGKALAVDSYTSYAIEEDAEEAPEDVTGSTLYELSDIGLNMEIPNAYYVLTRDMDENDPVLSELGFDTETVNGILETAGTWLDVFPSGAEWELGVSVFSNKDTEAIGDMALYSLEDIEKTFAGSEEELSKSVADTLGIDAAAVQVESSGAVSVGGYNYYRISVAVDYAAAVYSCEDVYFTVYGGTEYVFTFANQGDLPDLPQVEEEILSGVEFTFEPSGITEPPSGFSIDWSNVVVNTLIGALVGGTAGAVIAIKAKKKKKSAKAKQDEALTEAAPNEYGYSVPERDRENDVNDVE